MTYREVSPALVQTVLAHWQHRRALHWITRATGLDRKTVRRYAEAAAAYVADRTGDIARREAIDLSELVTHLLSLKARSVTRRRAKQGLLWAHREQIAEALRSTTTLRAAHALVRAQHIDVSYPTFRRFVRLELGGGSTARRCTRRSAE